MPDIFLPYKAKTYYLHAGRAEISTILFWWSIFWITAHLRDFLGIKHIITVCWFSIYQFLKLKSFLTQYVLINGRLRVIEKPANSALLRKNVQSPVLLRKIPLAGTEIVLFCVARVEIVRFRFVTLGFACFKLRSIDHEFWY